jgi:hypothetical protein
LLTCLRRGPLPLLLSGDVHVMEEEILQFYRTAAAGAGASAASTRAAAAAAAAAGASMRS